AGWSPVAAVAEASKPYPPVLHQGAGEAAVTLWIVNGVPHHRDKFRVAGCLLGQPVRIWHQQQRPQPGEDTDRDKPHGAGPHRSGLPLSHVDLRSSDSVV